MTDTDQYPQYLVAHIREVLAEDARTNLLDVQVKVLGDRIFVMGSVESEQRRLAADEVIRELVPEGAFVVNELCVVHYGTVPGAERLP